MLLTNNNMYQVEGWYFICSLGGTLLIVKELSCANVHFEQFLCSSSNK